jgi:hypothetical protein
VHETEQLFAGDEHGALRCRPDNKPKDASAERKTFNSHNPTQNNTSIAQTASNHVSHNGTHSHTHENLCKQPYQTQQ